MVHLGWILVTKPQQSDRYPQSMAGAGLTVEKGYSEAKLPANYPCSYRGQLMKLNAKFPQYFFFCCCFSRKRRSLRYRNPGDSWSYFIKSKTKKSSDFLSLFKKMHGFLKEKYRLVPFNFYFYIKILFLW